VKFQPFVKMFQRKFLTCDTQSPHYDFKSIDGHGSTLQRDTASK